MTEDRKALADEIERLKSALHRANHCIAAKNAALKVFETAMDMALAGKIANPVQAERALRVIRSAMNMEVGTHG